MPDTPQPPSPTGAVPPVPPPEPVVPPADTLPTTPEPPVSSPLPDNPIDRTPPVSPPPEIPPLPEDTSLSGLAQSVKDSTVPGTAPPILPTIDPTPPIISPDSSGTQPSSEPKKKKMPIGVLVLVLFIGLSIGGSVFYLTNKETALWYAAKAGVYPNYPETPPTMTCGNDITSQFFIRNNCGGGQVCSASPFTATIVTSTYGSIRVKYTTNDGHCSDVKVDVYLDDELKHQTDFIAPKGSTDYLNLGTVDAGSHSFKIIATGRPGGCNSGELYGWGGRLYFQCPVAATPTPITTPTDTVTPTSIPSSTPIPTETPTPTNPPSAPGVCDASCDNDSGCSSGFICASVGGVKRCRKPECPNEYTCVCPAATATPTPTPAPVVVVTATPTPITVVTATPTPTPVVVAAATPKIPVSGTGSVLGISTIAGGVLLLLLGLFL